jgi:hypothetical protein
MYLGSRAYWQNRLGLFGALWCLILFFGVGYGQDSLARIDTIRITDTVFIFKQSVDSLQNKVINFNASSIGRDRFITEFNAIQLMRHRKDSLLYDSSMIKLKEKYPLEHKVYNSVFLAKFGAVCQLICGSLSFSFVFIDANRTEKFNYQTIEPTYSSTGKFVANKTVTRTMSYKHKWNFGHTIISALSIGIILPAIFVLNF